MGSCAGSGAACSGSGCACSASCAAHRFDWRRETRLETAVAVPATTATRAAPLSSPGMELFLSELVDGRASPDGSGDRLGAVECVEQLRCGDTPAGHELRAAAVEGAHEGGGPPVLEEEDAGGAARLDDAAGPAHVVLVDQAGRGALEDGEVQLSVP